MDCGSAQQVRNCYQRWNETIAYNTDDILSWTLINVDASFGQYIYVGKYLIFKQGLYNPYTMTGTIVINGGVASVHSDWFLDGVFDKMGLTHLLPAAYQVCPLFHLLGECLLLAGSSLISHYTL
jgi:hypothetical protein